MGRDWEPGEDLVVTVVEGDPTVVRVVGEMDIASSPGLTAALSGQCRDIELDCSGVTFFGAAGVNALVAAHRSCAERGGNLVLVDPSPSVRRVLKIFQLDTVLTIRHDASRSS